MAAAVNEVLDVAQSALAAEHLRLQVQEERLADAKALARVVQDLADATTVDQAASVALNSVRGAFGLVYGSYWAVDPASRTLKFAVESGSVNEEFRRVTLSASFAEGVGLSGRAWRARDVVFVRDLGEVTDCVRAPVAQRAGVKSGICLPIVVKGEVAGTMDFFALETLNPSAERLEALRNVGRLVSGAIEQVRNAGILRKRVD
jgi:methyl-accepting chemotaxis protein